ncbi:hypothetical protein [Compostibacter hankyongensis]
MATAVRGRSLAFREPAIGKPGDSALLIRDGIYHIIMYGQSLMLGTTSIPVITKEQKYNTLMFSGGVRSGYDGDSVHFYDSLVPLVEKEVRSAYTGTLLGETPASGFSETFLSLLIRENHLSFDARTRRFDRPDFSLLLSSPAQGSMSAEALTDEGPYWERFKRDVRAGYALATARGKPYNVPFILWNQGERDIDLKTSPEIYKARLRAFRSKADRFIKSVTHQKNNVWLVLYQTVSHNVRKAAGNPTIANAQYELAREDSFITMSNTTYQLPYSGDHVHFTNAGSKWNGACYAVACKRMLADGGNWRPVFVKNAVRSGRTVRLTFHVPVPPLVWDTVTVTNPGNFGFRLFDDNGKEISIRKVMLTGASSVKIIAGKKLPPGSVLWYGNNGTGTGPLNGARGNLRDSQGRGIYLDIGGRNIPIDNWMPLFKQAL